ncbi:PAS domain S-box protein [Marinoscillum pacificum]|uniref:PAS domain S-box protein n=1 Tax=Marinoscillum pacificum TaxID=392723 RepID=UPI0021581FD6|nr:PAS domain S-box protein [Marinoscillum pacificum]
MDVVNSDIKSLQEEVAALKKELDKSHRDYYDLVDKTNFHLKELFDSSNDLIQIFKPNGDFRFVNEAWRNKLGYREEEVFDLKFMDVVHPDYRKKTLSNLLKITAGSSLERFETVLRTKYGKNIYVIGKLTSVFENGDPVEYRCVFFDITERFRAERAQSLYYKIANITIIRNRLEDFYGQIYHELNEILKVRNFSVAMRSNKAYQYAYWINEHEETTGATLKKDVERLLADYTFERGKPLIIYNEGIEKIASQKKVKLYDPLPNIWLGVLIQMDAKPIGVLSIFSYLDQSAYNHKDLELLDFISGQITLALERKQNEEKIQNQGARINAIFESSTHQIWSLNRSYTFTSFNQNYADAFVKYYGFTPEIGMSLPMLDNKNVKKQTIEFWTKKYDAAFSGESLNFQHSIKTLKGKKVWRDVFINPIFLPDGSIHEISVIANDITEKKSSETALKESEEKFRNIFESFQDIYFRCDMDGIISMVSPSVERVLGYSPQEIIGNQITQFFISKSKLSQLFKSLYEHKQVQNFEGEVKTRTGEEIQFLSNVRLIKRTRNQFEIEGVARDISKLKETNKQLREAKEVAERSLQIRERFLANMSHEIRTPMNGVIGMIDLLGSTELDEEQSEYIRTIKKSSDSLLHILNDILDLSKIEAGKMKLRQDPVKLIDTFEKVYELYSQQAHLSKNSLYYHLDESLPEYILADETRLTQVLSNLTSNAIKFSPQKGTINLSIRVMEQKSNKYKFKVSIKDSGIGISKKDIDKLFQNFSQIDSSSSKNFSGTGLGLAISKELVKSMDGDIGVASTPGFGSTFWFTFWAESIPSEQVVEKKDDGAIIKEFKETSPRILLVDDNNINRNVACTILTKAGCQVEEAQSGFEAIEKVKAKKFDLIFMDIQMPEMDGVEATQKIKGLKLKNLAPIVAMTAYSMEEDRTKFLSKGLDDYIAKPIKAINLIDKVKSWIHFEPKSVNSEVFKETTEELVINQNTLNQLYKFGGKELIESVLADFDVEATQQVIDSKKYLKSHDYELMRQELHTLKGNAGTFGIERLATIAMKMEQNLKVGPYDELSDDMKMLEFCLEEFKESYHTFINT